MLIIIIYMNVSFLIYFLELLFTLNYSSSDLCFGEFTEEYFTLKQITIYVVIPY